MKSLKFKNNLASLILSGEKNSTWRLFDDKDLQKGDEILLINKDTNKEFGTAIIVSVIEKKLGEIGEADFEGHEKFESKEKMYETFRSYYGEKVNEETLVKIIKFELAS
jgi:hypothetical protein